MQDESTIDLGPGNVRSSRTHSHSGGGLIEAKLTCNAGPALGTEFPLKGEDATVGRAADNAVSVPDTSVSRRHVQITKAVDGWKAKDLGSGNGTLLNGEKLDAEASLHNGDVLTLGNTQLTFQDLANSTDRVAAPVRPPAVISRPPVPRRPTSGLRPDSRVRVSRQMPATRPGGSRRLRLLVLSILLVIGAAGVGLLHLRKMQAQKRDLENQHISKLRAEHDQLAEVMQSGKNATREGDWREAVVLFEKVRKIDPAFPELQAYLARAPKELEIQKKLDAAQKAMDDGKLGQAGVILNQANTESGLYNPRLRELQAKLERLESTRFAAAKTATSEGNLDHARSLVADLLKASPDDREAQLLLEEIDVALANRNHKRGVSTPVTRPPVAEARVWEPAVQRYVEGDLAGAAGIANACAATSAHCREMSKDLSEFTDLHRKMDDLEPKGLKRLIQLDHELGEGKKSRLIRPAALRLANQLYRQAAAAKTAGDWARAKDLARQVLDLDPANTGANAVLEQATHMAKELYYHAYSVQESNYEEAIKTARQVEEMTPPDDEYHKKAQKLLEKLSR